MESSGTIRRRRFWALFLAFVMVVGLLPVAKAKAEDKNGISSLSFVSEENGIELGEIFKAGDVLNGTIDIEEYEEKFLDVFYFDADDENTDLASDRVLYYSEDNQKATIGVFDWDSEQYVPGYTIQDYNTALTNAEREDGELDDNHYSDYWKVFSFENNNDYGDTSLLLKAVPKYTIQWNLNYTNSLQFGTDWGIDGNGNKWPTTYIPEVDEEIYIPGYKPISRAGYEFVGWGTMVEVEEDDEEDGDEDTYYEIEKTSYTSVTPATCDDLADETIDDDYAIVFYAIWKPVYTLRFYKGYPGQNVDQDKINGKMISSMLNGVEEGYYTFSSEELYSSDEYSLVSLDVITNVVCEESGRIASCVREETYPSFSYKDLTTDTITVNKLKEIGAEYSDEENVLHLAAFWEPIYTIEPIIYTDADIKAEAENCVENDRIIIKLSAVSEDEDRKQEVDEWLESAQAEGLISYYYIQKTDRHGKAVETNAVVTGAAITVAGEYSVYAETTDPDISISSDPLGTIIIEQADPDNKPDIDISVSEDKKSYSVKVDKTPIENATADKDIEYSFDGGKTFSPDNTYQAKAGEKLLVKVRFAKGGDIIPPSDAVAVEVTIPGSSKEITYERITIGNNEYIRLAATDSAIYYTTDGSEPTVAENSEVRIAQGSVDILLGTQTVTIKAVALEEEKILGPVLNLEVSKTTDSYTTTLDTSVTGLNLSVYDGTINLDGNTSATMKVTAEIVPSYASDKTIIWSIRSDSTGKAELSATESQSGVPVEITGRGAGTVYITATSKSNSNISAVLKVCIEDHNWVYKKIKWNKDFSYATAVFKCGKCKEKQSVTAQMQVSSAGKDKRKITAYTATVDIGPDGKKLDKTVTETKYVKVDGTEATKKDYDYQILVDKGIGDEDGEFSISFADTTEFAWDLETKEPLKGKFFYTGQKIMPEIVVKKGDRVLLKDYDYKVTYKNNVNATDKAAIKIIGKTYDISFTLNFEIVPAPIEWVEEQVYAVKSGKVYIDGLYYKGYKLGSKDYSYDKKIIVATNDNPLSLGHEEAGNEIIAMSGEFIKVSGKGNFTGTKYIAVSKVEESKKNKISVAFKPVARTYNATPQFIDIGKELVVKSNGKQISEWSYYKIDGDSHVEVAEGEEYDEKVQNFTVLYSREPIDAGSVKITIIGMGDYKGTISKTYRINPRKVSSGLNVEFLATVTDSEGNEVEKTDYSYQARGVTPTVVVTDSSSVNTKDEYTENDMPIKLVLGKDYKVSYKDHKKVGNKATVRVTFIGNYKGTREISRTYKITKVKLADPDVDVKISTDEVLVYKNTGKYLSVPYVTVNGELLPKSEYTVMYFDEAGKDISKQKISLEEGQEKNITVKISTNRNYDDTGAEERCKTKYIVKYLSEGQKNISKASLAIVNSNYKKVTSVQYTGLPIYFDGSAGISLQLTIGGVTLSGTDIDKWFNVRYINNVNKGSATIVVSSRTDMDNNPYVGSKSTKFTIKAGGKNISLTDAVE